MNNPQINIKFISKNTLDYDKYIKLVHQAINMNCEEIIKTHNNLMGVIDSNGICKTEYGEKFILNILNYDFGYSYAKDTPEELIKFFNSKHTSDYLKKLINKYNNNSSTEIYSLVNSDKNLKEFTEEELYKTYKLLEKYGLGEIIIALSFHLNSQSAISFLNNKISSINLIKRVVCTSGLTTRLEYYSQRGARLSDLNGKMLYSIYNKLTRLDKNKGLSMAIMTLTMDSLKTTEFLKNLYNLVANNYNLESLRLSDNNYSPEIQRYDENNIYNNQLDKIKVDDTEEIKEQFKKLLPQTILEYIYQIEQINQELYKYKQYMNNQDCKRRIR